MGTRTLGAELDEESELYERFEEFEERYETRSEALRSLMRKGFEAEEGDARADDLAGYIAVTATVASAILAVAVPISAIAIFLGVAFGIAPGTLAILALSGAVVAFSSHFLASAIRFIDERLLAPLASRLPGGGRA